MQIKIVPFEKKMQARCYDLVMVAYTETTKRMCWHYTTHPVTMTVGVMWAMVSFAYALLQNSWWLLVFSLASAYLFLYAVYYIILIRIYKEYYWTLPDYGDLTGLWKPPNRLWIAELRPTREVVGTVGMQHLTKDKCEILRMNVKLGFRRYGIGTRLMQHCLEQCRKLGYTQVVLGTSNFQQPAKKLYEKCGFKITHSEQFYIFSGLLKCFKEFHYAFKIDENELQKTLEEQD